MITLEIASSPWGEPCAQVGQDGYGILAQAECKALIGQIRRVFGNEPEGARLFVKSNAHDFGSYYEVAVRFDESKRKAEAWAERVSEKYPEKWDETALRELSDSEARGYVLKDWPLKQEWPASK